MTPVYEQLHRKFGTYMVENEVEALILDGELLPWKALGDGLIERQFRPIGKALETELAFCASMASRKHSASLLGMPKQADLRRISIICPSRRLAISTGYMPIRTIGM